MKHFQKSRSCHKALKSSNFYRFALFEIVGVSHLRSRRHEARRRERKQAVRVQRLQKAERSTTWAKAHQIWAFGCVEAARTPGTRFTWTLHRWACLEFQLILLGSLKRTLLARHNTWASITKIYESYSINQPRCLSCILNGNSSLSNG